MPIPPPTDDRYRLAPREAERAVLASITAALDGGADAADLARDALAGHVGMVEQAALVVAVMLAERADPAVLREVALRLEDE